MSLNGKNIAGVVSNQLVSLASREKLKYEKDLASIRMIGFQSISFPSE